MIVSKKTKIIFYSLLSVIGFVLPNIIVFQTITTTGTYDFAQLLAVYNLNLYARFIAVDLSIAALTFLAYFAFNFKTVKHSWLALVGTFLVGFSFGFPLFLLLNELDNSKKSEVN